MSFDFNGWIKEFPGVRIDNFNRGTGEHKDEVVWEYFLSHAHSDHTSGLESLVSGPVYMTPGTRAYLRALPKYERVLKEVLIHELPYDRPVDIVRNGIVKYQAVAVNANHCPGSSMILLYDSTRAILYTGDVRAEEAFVNTLPHNPALISFTRLGRVLDCIYIDSTFISRAEATVIKDNKELKVLDLVGLHLDIPANIDGIRKFIECQLPNYLDSTYICCDGKFTGFEQAILWFAAALERKIGKVKVHVTEELRRIYLMTKDHDATSYRIWNYLLKDGEEPENAMLHFCSKKECKVAERHDAIYIRFYIRPQLNQPTGWIEGKNGEKVATRLYIAQSRHSSLKEMKNLVKVFTPRDVIPIVDPSIFRELRITVRELFGKFCSPHASFSFNMSLDSEQVQPLPSKKEVEELIDAISKNENLMTRQRFAYQTRHNGETQSSNEYDSDYEIPSSPVRSGKVNNGGGNNNETEKEVIPNQDGFEKAIVPVLVNSSAQMDIEEPNGVPSTPHYNAQGDGDEANGPSMPDTAQEKAESSELLNSNDNAHVDKENSNGGVPSASNGAAQVDDLNRDMLSASNGAAQVDDPNDEIMVKSSDHEDGKKGEMSIARSLNTLSIRANATESIIVDDQSPSRKRKRDNIDSTSQKPTAVRNQISVEIIEESVLVMNPLTTQISYSDHAVVTSSMIPTPQTPRKQIIKEPELNEIPETPAQRLPTAVRNRIYLALSPKNSSPKKRSQPWETGSSSQPIAVSSIAKKKKDDRTKRILTVRRQQPKRVAKGRNNKTRLSAKQNADAMIAHDFNEADILESNDEDQFRLQPVDLNRVGSIFFKINEEMSNYEFSDLFNLTCV
ncbi:hypothetical protein TRVA0_047S00144 [Trichomonascus vanleenenianus]|uniref:uncharacterized protein n=1 Tax=Trichomonascus vanleenenianus TaxID=2268995 RepID=UPI003ECA388A